MSVLQVWIFATFAVAATQKPVCLYRKTGNPQPLSQLCTRLQCKEGHVISHLHIETGHSNTTSKSSVSNKRPKKNETCYGETAKYIHQSNDCYWKQSCKIGFPMGKINRSTREQDYSLPDCFNKDADFQCVLNIRCIKHLEIIDIGTKNCTGEIRKIKQKKGIIRSHPTYPWLQDNTEDVKSNCPLRKNITRETKLAFYDIDIAYESVINITTALRTITANSTHFTDGKYVWDVSDVLTFSAADKHITLKFVLEPTTSNRFIICFKEDKGQRKKSKKKCKKCRRKQKRNYVKVQESGKDFCVKMMRKAKVGVVSYESRKCKARVKTKNKSKSERRHRSKRESSSAEEECCCFPENRASCDYTINYIGARLKSRKNG